MQRISSKATYYQKRLLPIFWFGFLGFMIIVGFYSTVFKKDGPPTAVLIVPLIMAAFGFFLFKKILFDLVDEVYDCGSFLLIKNGDTEESIPLSNIKNVNYSVMVNPPRVTLSLRESCSFGHEISFSPPARFSFNLFQKNLMIEDLIDRIDKSRKV